MAKPSLASWYFQELSSNALDGMQPTFRQVPPRAILPSLSWYFSIQAVFRPSCAALMAATYPPGPPPLTAPANFWDITYSFSNNPDGPDPGPPWEKLAFRCPAAGAPGLPASS